MKRLAPNLEKPRQEVTVKLSPQEPPCQFRTVTVQSLALHQIRVCETFVRRPVVIVIQQAWHL